MCHRWIFLTFSQLRIPTSRRRSMALHRRDMEDLQFVIFVQQRGLDGRKQSTNNATWTLGRKLLTNAFRQWKYSTITHHRFVLYKLVFQCFQFQIWILTTILVEWTSADNGQSGFVQQVCTPISSNGSEMLRASFSAFGRGLFYLGWFGYINFSFLDKIWQHQIISDYSPDYLSCLVGIPLFRDCGNFFQPVEGFGHWALEICGA